MFFISIIRRAITEAQREEGLNFVSHLSGHFGKIHRLQDCANLAKLKKSVLYLYDKKVET